MASESIAFYWRPGCGFCMRLDRGLSRLGVAVDKQNIWDEPDAAAFVRSVANGHETVPTVVVGDQALVNPSLDLVVAALHEFAPDLIPDELPERQGLVSRIFSS